jgi:alkyldihydroxyacetonephosphate synthase
MRRWNGWGDESIKYPLEDSAAAFLSQLLGDVEPVPDAPFETVAAVVPESRLAEHPLVSVEPAGRLRHARGQSLPDWIALRSGRIGLFPDGVAHPTSAEQVRALLDYARTSGARLIPYGGGTSVVGHINPLPSDAPLLTVDLTGLRGLVDLDVTSRLATFGAGASGPQIESQLRERGYTLGHYPQSYEYSTLGGWIATRSSGQQSLYYGRIEDLFAGGIVETPSGSLRLPALPASAAGPDLRQLILGSEGRFGIITQTTVRVRPLPESEGFYAIFFTDWDSGMAAVRTIVQSRIPVSMLRLSDAQETQTTLALAGRERLVELAGRGLELLSFGPERCLLLFGVTGRRRTTREARRRVAAVALKFNGLFVGGAIGKIWRKSRFRSPYLRNTLWERGYAVDTLETAVPWSAVSETAAAIRLALSNGLAGIGKRVLVLIHLSHVYEDGASLYATYLFRRADDPDETLRRWQLLKKAASETIVARGGTISHQHGVGSDHAAYLAAEKGELGIRWLEAARQSVDPQGILNPGKLLNSSNLAKVLGEIRPPSQG